MPVDIIITVFDDRIAAVPALELQKTIQAQLTQAGLIKRPNTD